MPSNRTTRTGPKTKTIAERFWPKVQKTDTCWLWTAYRIPNGYGTIGKGGHDGGMVYAHRLSWELHYGTVPDGLSVLHHCDVRHCVRPTHLFLGTQIENIADATHKGRVPKGGGHWNAKITANMVRSMRERYTSGERISDIAFAFGVHRITVFDVIHRKTWKHVH